MKRAIEESLRPQMERVLTPIRDAAKVRKMMHHDSNNQVYMFVQQPTFFDQLM